MLGCATLTILKSLIESALDQSYSFNMKSNKYRR